MNQASSQNIASTAFSSIRSSIPITLKPPPLSSLVRLSYASKQHSVLAPSSKRSAPIPIVLSPSPVIPLSDFQPYLQELQAELDRWQSLSPSNSRTVTSHPTAEPLLGLIHHHSPPTFPRGPPRELPSLSAVPDVFFNRIFSLNDPATFDLLTQHQLQPSGSTSSLNSTQRQTSKSPASIADLATDHILLDKLSHYLDVVELHLVHEIGLRSSSFFSALGNLQSLHAQTSESVAQIEALKNQLDQLKQTVADKALNIIRYGVRRRNIANIELALTKISHVSQTVLEIEQLIQSGEWHSALGLIEDLEKLWHSNAPLSPATDDQPTVAEQSSHPVPTPQVKFRLSKLKALSALPKRLLVLRSTISRALEAELSSILSHDLKINLAHFANAHTADQAQSNAVQSPTSIHSLSSSSLPPSQSDGHMKSVAKSKLKERIRSTFNGLTRADGMDNALAAWREGVVKQIRNIVKEALSDVIEGDINDEDDESDISQFNSKDKRSTLSEKTMTLTRNLKALKHADFLKIAEETYRNLLGCIELVDTQSRALLELAEELKSQSAPPAVSDLPVGSNSSKPLETISELDAPKPFDMDTFSLKLNEIVQTSAELANARFAKVIGVRTEVHAQLSFTDFFAIFDASWRFVIQCEVISRRMIIALRGVMVSQAKAFLQSFHQSKITESAKIVEQEQWTAVDVPSQVQETVNLIVCSAMEDPASLIITQKNNPNVVVPAHKEATTDQSSKQLEIEGTFYHAVSAALETLNTISDYLRVVVNCSLLTTDLMGKIIEFLKAFNSRICQVVLGAGAIRSAGLKNITAKHLALASQALSTMINLIPYIRECLRRHLSMKQAVMLVDFDKLKRDYQEHQNEVHSKLVSIMADRLTVHKQALQSIDWESLTEPAPDQDVSPNTYLESLLKEVGTLHRVLGRYLSASTLKYILSQVFSAINAVLVEEFDRIEIQSTQGKTKLLRDAQYFSSKLIELNASEECQSEAKALEDLVQKRFFPKELNVTSPENKNTSTPENTSPISPLAERAESFRSKFRFLSPARKLSVPLLAAVTDPAAPSSPREDKLPTPASPVGSFTETEPRRNGLETTDESNEPSTLDDAQVLQEKGAETEQPGEDLSIDRVSDQPKESVIQSPNTSVSPAPAPTDPSGVSSSPQPTKLTLSQRLSALASNRRGSQTYSTTSSPTNNNMPHSIPAVLDQMTSQTTDDPPMVTVPVASTPVPVPHQVEPPSVSSVQEELAEQTASTKPKPVPRLSFKERLAAIAAKAASNPSSSSRQPVLQHQPSEEVDNHRPEEQAEGGDDSCTKPSAGLTLNSDSTNPLPPTNTLPSTEELKLLPALPCSPRILVTTEDQVNKPKTEEEEEEVNGETRLDSVGHSNNFHTDIQIDPSGYVPPGDQLESSNLLLEPPPPIVSNLGTSHKDINDTSKLL